MLSSVIILLIALAFLHFIYEGIIAPSIRQKLRFRLFALRDRVRNLKVEHGDELEDRTFNYLQDSINTTIRLIHSINVIDLCRIYRDVSKDERLSQIIEKRNQAIEQSPIAEIKLVRHESLKAFTLALLTNHGGLCLYVFPVLFVIVIISVFSAIVVDSVMSAVATVLAMPKRDIDRLADSHRYQFG